MRESCGQQRPEELREKVAHHKQHARRALWPVGSRVVLLDTDSCTVCPHSKARQVLRQEDSMQETQLAYVGTSYPCQARFSECSYGLSMDMHRIT